MRSRRLVPDPDIYVSYFITGKANYQNLIVLKHRIQLIFFRNCSMKLKEYYNTEAAKIWNQHQTIASIYKRHLNHSNSAKSNKTIYSRRCKQ